MKNKKNQILKAAEKEFLAKGYAGARTMEIAKAAGVTHAMLHYYFNTKAQLFQEIIASKIGLFIQSIEIEMTEEKDVPIKQQILRVVERHFDFLRENPDLPRFIMTNITNEKAISLVMNQVLPIISTKIQQFDPILKHKEINIDTFTLGQDILSINMSAFLMLPLLEQAGIDCNEYLDQRKKEALLIMERRLS